MASATTAAVGNLWEQLLGNAGTTSGQHESTVILLGAAAAARAPSSLQQSLLPVVASCGLSLTSLCASRRACACGCCNTFMAQARHPLASPAW
jgi:hypothetical protein